MSEQDVLITRETADVKVTVQVKDLIIAIQIIDRFVRGGLEPAELLPVAVLRQKFIDILVDNGVKENQI